jgi:DNA polymerase-3 subunit gamma/tau
MQSVREEVATPYAAEATVPAAAVVTPARAPVPAVSPEPTAAMPKLPPMASTPLQEAPAAIVATAVTPVPPAVPEVAVAAPVALEPRDWPQLIERAGLRGPLGQLAQHAALLAVDGDVLRLALKPEHENLHSPAMASQLQERLAAATGRPLRLNFERARAGVETPAEQIARTRSARQQQAEQDMEQDPFVQAAMREFDARIVPQSVRVNDSAVSGP